MLHNYSFVNLPRQAIAPRRLLYISLETASKAYRHTPLLLYKNVTCNATVGFFPLL